MYAEAPVAIVDIGSNSVRLVVYSGATRLPSVIFNEKVMAGLGRGLEATGTLSDEAQDRALTAMARFRLLVQRMGVVRTRVVATAAVRDAVNAGPFLDEVRRLGFEPLVLAGEEEARLAALGVISGIPGADGVIGDLGGGSLELADVRDGAVRGRGSLPLGVLRLAALGRADATLLRRINRQLEQADFARTARGRAFYLVGGSWRALARLDLALTDHPLPVTHQHLLAPGRPEELHDRIVTMARQDPKSSGITAARVPSLPYANLLLRGLVESFRPEALVISSFGVREGLLYDDLDPQSRALDPLIEAARQVGAGLGRFQQHGEALDRWIAPVFGDTPRQARLRLAACLLSDIGWAAHPDFRAERGIDMALHGNWVAIDARGRALLATALFANFGGSTFPYPRIAALCSDGELRRARLWGLAIRLAQRMSGGVEAPLRTSRLALEGDDRIVLRLPNDEAAMYSEPVERRFKTLAAALGRKAEMRIG